MSEERAVTWREAASTTVGCWAVVAGTWGFLALIDERELPVAGPVVAVLIQWFFFRHRHWGAGVAAGIAGSVVVLGLVDRVRPLLEDRLFADSLTTAAGVAVALTVFTASCRGHRT